MKFSLKYTLWNNSNIWIFNDFSSSFFQSFSFDSLSKGGQQQENICKNEPVKTCPTTIYNLYPSKSIQGWCKITSIFGRKKARSHPIEQEGLYFVWCEYDGKIELLIDNQPLWMLI